MTVSVPCPHWKVSVFSVYSVVSFFCSVPRTSKVLESDNAVGTAQAVLRKELTRRVNSYRRMKRISRILWLAYSCLVILRMTRSEEIKISSCIRNIRSFAVRIGHYVNNLQCHQLPHQLPLNSHHTAMYIKEKDFIIATFYPIFIIIIHKIPIGPHPPTGNAGNQMDKLYIKSKNLYKKLQVA